MRGRAQLIVAATVLVAAAYAGGTATPAVAVACSSSDGVTVVVDFHGLGGGLQQVCDAGGGGQKASTLFTGNGFDLMYVQKQPGFVCRVQAQPAEDPCVNTPPADAYWGLWWSDGTSGQWTYSSLGVASLEIPEGGSVAFSWNSGSGQDKPGAAPPRHQTPSATPTPSPSATGGGGNSGGNGESGGDGDGSGPGTHASPTTTTTSEAPSQSGDPNPSPKPTKSAKPDKSERPTSSASGSTEQTTTGSAEVEVLEDAEPTASPPAAGDGGLPVWLAPVVVVVLFAAATAVALVRRRRRSAGPPGP